MPMTRGRGLASLLAIMFLAPMLAGCTELLGSGSPPTANMSLDPSGTVKAGDSVIFSAAGSSDPDGDSLTFDWDFGDGNTGTGLTTTHSYAQPGDYTVELAVGDGKHEVTTSKTITVVDASAKEPAAVIAEDKADDCDGDESSANGVWIIVWVCDEDNDINDREVSVSTSVTLDGSGSWAGCDPEDSGCYDDGSYWIDEWKWDLDTNVDSDDDGITDNDVDATGETYTWEDMSEGHWEIKLTVVDNNGFESSETADVAVNYRGIWKDFVIDRATPNNPVIMTWEAPVKYDDESEDRIRYLRTMLEYPKEDEDQPGGGLPGQTTSNKLDIYIYNSTDDEVANTSEIGNDNRDAGDCESDEYCVWSIIYSSLVKSSEPGDWTVDLENAETHNTNVNRFVIILEYRK